VDLHRGLFELATGMGKGFPAIVLLRFKAVDVDCEEGTVRFEDGMEVQGDLVFIALSVHVSPPSTRLLASKLI
jgi:hypothetical protein